MNLDFWVTIAQISATFTGLVFVGFSIYLKGIREAIDSIDQLFGSNNGLQEKSSYLITSLALSNITFLLLPLITALSILSAQNGRSLLYPYIITNIFLVVFFFYQFFNKQVSSERKTISFERNRDLFLKGRILSGNVIVILFIVIFLCLTIGILISPPSSYLFNGFNIAIEVFCFISLLFGLGLSLYDLYLFDTDHILFEITSDFEAMVNVINAELHSEALCIEPLYQQFLNSLECHTYQIRIEQIQRENPDGLKNINDESSLIISDYAQIRCEIPKESAPKIVQELRAKGRVLSCCELRKMVRRRKVLSEKIKGLTSRMNNWLKFFKAIATT